MKGWNWEYRLQATVEVCSSINSKRWSSSIISCYNTKCTKVTFLWSEWMTVHVVSANTYDWLNVKRLKSICSIKYDCFLSTGSITVTANIDKASRPSLPCNRFGHFLAALDTIDTTVLKRDHWSSTNDTAVWISSKYLLTMCFSHRVFSSFNKRALDTMKKQI